MHYKSFYINLDRSTERRVEMEAQLSGFGLRDHYCRFPGSDGNSLGFPNGKLLPGEIGCFTSHYLLLKEHIGQTQPLHVVEDDVLFSRFTAAAVGSTAESDHVKHYDIVYTDVYIPVSNILYKKYRDIYQKSIHRDDKGNIVNSDFNIIDMKNVGFASTTSMIINPSSIEKIVRLYAEVLQNGASKPIDLFLREKADEGRLKIGCLFPFVTSVRLEASVFGTTIDPSPKHYSQIAGTLARQAFFLDCDWNKCREFIHRYLTMPLEDDQLQLLTHILGFTLDERFRFE